MQAKVFARARDNKLVFCACSMTDCATICVEISAFTRLEKTKWLQFVVVLVSALKVAKFMWPQRQLEVAIRANELRRLSHCARNS